MRLFVNLKTGMTSKPAKLIKNLMDMVKGNPLYKEAQEVFESLAIVSIENIRINKKSEND